MNIPALATLLSVVILGLSGCGEKEKQNQELPPGGEVTEKGTDARATVVIKPAAGHVSTGTANTLRITGSSSTTVNLNVTGPDPDLCSPNAGNGSNIKGCACRHSKNPATGPRGHYIEVVSTSGRTTASHISGDSYKATISTMSGDLVYAFIRRKCGEIVTSTMDSFKVGSADPSKPFITFGVRELALPTQCCTYKAGAPVPLDFAYWGSGDVYVSLRNHAAGSWMEYPLILDGGTYHGIYHITGAEAGTYDIVVLMKDSGDHVIASDTTTFTVA